MDLAPASLFGTSLRFLAVFAAAAVALRALDEVPELILGAEEATFASIPELERSARAAVLLPSYFPDTLAWPPSAIRASTRPAAAVLTFDGAGGVGARVVLAQALQEGASVDHLLGDEVVLERFPAAEGPEGATLALVKVADGSTWRELAWEVEGRTVRMRSAGTLEELTRMARSVRREHR